MPTIPTYDNAQTQLRALPGVRAEAPGAPPSAAPLANAGRALMAAGDSLAGVARAQQERENADLLFRAETALRDDYLKFEQDVRNNRRGQAAWGVTQDAEKWFGEAAGRHSGIFTNDVQRSLFAQQTAKLRQQALNSLSAYEAGERRTSLNESAQASIASAINLAAANAADPAAVASARKDVDARLQVLAGLNGWSPELRDAKRAEYVTALHTQVLQNLVDANPTAARAYYDANKNEINGTARDGIEKTLKVAGLKTLAQSVADDMMARGVPEADAIKLVREKYSGEEEAAAVLEIRTRFQEGRAAREQAQRDAADEAWGIFARRGYSAIPASLLAKLDGQTLLAMQRDAENRVRGKAVKTDFETLYEIRQLMRDDPIAFGALDLRKYVNKLSASDLEELAKLQTQPDTRQDAATLSQQLGAAHNLLKFGRSDTERKGQFDAAVMQAINDEQNRVKRKLSFKERQEIIDRYMVEGEVSGGGLFGLIDPDRRFYQVAGTPDAGTFVPSVPKAERKKIEEALRRAKKPVTDENVLALYRAKVGL